MNEELKEKCSILKEYMIYVEKVREYAKSMEFKDAVEKAIEYCIKHNILRDFLLKQRAEVIKMSIYEYDEERELKLIRADERELGEEIGIKKGREEERKNTEEAIENNIKTIVSLCKEFGSTKEETVEKLIEKCNLSKENAQEKVNNYWEKEA